MCKLQCISKVIMCFQDFFVYLQRSSQHGTTVTRGSHKSYNSAVAVYTFLIKKGAITKHFVLRFSKAKSDYCLNIWNKKIGL